VYTLVSTSTPRWFDGAPTRALWSGVAWSGSRTTATVTRLILLTLPLVGRHRASRRLAKTSEAVELAGIGRGN